MKTDEFKLCPHRVNTALQCCPACDSDRNTGKTLRMVQALPAHRSLVLVHNDSMKRYVERMIRNVRPELRVNHDVYVRVIQTERDTDWLRGLTDREVRVDHSVWEQLAPRITDYLRVVMRAQFRPHAPRPGLQPREHWPTLQESTPSRGLGVVDATIERDERGAIRSVTLPGKDWS
jgi:hypothetical protein